MVLKVHLNKELEKRFREIAMRKFGYSRGSIKKATSFAIESWTKESLKEIKSGEVDGEKFVEEFISVIPKQKKLKKISIKDIKKILEEEYERV